MSCHILLAGEDAQRLCGQVEELGFYSHGRSLRAATERPYHPNEHAHPTPSSAWPTLVVAIGTEVYSGVPIGSIGQISWVQSQPGAWNFCDLVRQLDEGRASPYLIVAPPGRDDLHELLLGAPRLTTEWCRVWITPQECRPNEWYDEWVTRWQRTIDLSQVGAAVVRQSALCELIVIAALDTAANHYDRRFCGNG